MKFPNARKFFGRMRKRIYGIFGRKIGATPSKSKQPPPIEHHRRLPMELECKSTTAITMDLPRPHHRKLPAELNREIFLCFNVATQHKFIWGLGWDFYAMFRQKLLTKTKRVCNPPGNRWNRTNTRDTITADGLNVSNNTNGFPNVFAEQPFPISGPYYRADDFPGTILYYYEVKAYYCYVGLSDGATPDKTSIGKYPNSYAVPFCRYRCCLAGRTHRFILPEGTIRPRLESGINVYGCGLVLGPANNLAIFFTLNGILLGRKIPISPTVDCLYPAVTTMWYKFPFEANFGDDPAKPFEYDIRNCSGLELDCI